MASRCLDRSATGASRTRTTKRTEQESNLNEHGARLAQGPMTGAPTRTPTLSHSSCGWDRTSVGLRHAELTAPCDYQQSPHRNSSQQPVLVSSQLDRGSEPPSPA